MHLLVETLLCIDKVNLTTTQANGTTNAAVDYRLYISATSFHIIIKTQTIDTAAHRSDAGTEMIEKKQEMIETVNYSLKAYILFEMQYFNVRVC